MDLRDNSYFLSWDCRNGENCFNKKMRLKFAVFGDCFPGKINFTDIDGIVEIDRCFLLLEWKSKTETIPTGQRIMFERMTTHENFAVFVVIGDAEFMTVRKVCHFYMGKQSPWVEGDLEYLKARVSRWVAFAKNKSLTRSA